MEASSQDQVIAKIELAYELGDPTILLGSAEESLWLWSKDILSEPENGDTFGSHLMQLLADGFTHISNRPALQDFLSYVLSLSKNAFTYEHTAGLILRYSKEWDFGVARHFMDLFKAVYQTTRTSDEFVSYLALEGVTMLPILRGEKRLLPAALDLLLNEFPESPKDDYQQALLPIKALKLLGRYYDFSPDEQVASKIEELRLASNVWIRAEAYFDMGIVRLYQALQSENANTLQSQLEAARNYFDGATRLEENRTDAELLRDIIDCFVEMLMPGEPIRIADKARHAQAVLAERILVLSGTSYVEDESERLDLTRLVFYLERWSENLKEAERWWNVTTSINALAAVYAAVRATEIKKGLVGLASKAAADLVMLPYMQSKFLKVQEIAAKIQGALSSSWRELASPQEIEFYELVLQQIEHETLIIPKDSATANIQRLLAVAKKAPLSPVTHRFTAQVQNLLNSGIGPEQVILEALSAVLEQEQERERQFFSNPAQEIYQTILLELREKLDWPPQSINWEWLLFTLREVVHYYDLTDKLNVPDAKFLFAEEVGGLGKQATEEHLEKHFFERKLFTSSGVRLARQSTGLTPGRLDLSYQCPSGIIFPIEVKCEDANTTRENIHAKYIAQAQRYAAAQSRFGYLFVLDTTAKDPRLPLRPMIENVYLDTISLPHTTHNVYVMVVIFPANRVRPSDHTNMPKTTIG
ncbi:hypothetical protein ANRL4_02811 [Anaerolineae bacterium]|nr:hypothetical protein ANRL4_02811 [Anaerolineae bacterium]